MGLLSFLTRRNSDRTQEPPVQHLAYHSTVASFPPVRGTHPVSGNGPASYEQLRRAAARKRSQPQMSAPMKPLFLGARDDRPSSAPYEDSPDWRPKSSGRNPRDAIRGFQFPVISNHGLGRRSNRFDTDAESLAPSVPSIAAYSARDPSTAAYSTRAPSVAAHSARDPSIGPARSTTRYVDILDAQGDIKPYDFRSRVKAAGTRDYGEDVADRNMDLNGVKATTPAAEAHHAPSIKASPLRERAGNAGTAIKTIRHVVAMPAIAQLGEQPPPARKGGPKRNSLSSMTGTDELVKQRRPRAQRTKSLDSNALLSLPEGHISRKSSARRQRSAEDRGVERRGDRSTSRDGTASPRIWISTERRGPTGQAREHGRSPLGPPPAESQPSSRSASPPAVPRYRPRTALGTAVEHAAGYSSTASTVRGTLRSERSRSRGIDADHRAQTPSSTSRRSHRSRDRHTDANSLRSTISHVNRRREHREQLDAPLEAESSDEGSVSDSAPAPRISHRRGEDSHSLAHSRQGSHQQWNSPWSHVRADPFSAQPGPSDLAASLAHSRNRSWSCISTHTRANLDEYAGYIPARKSSLRQWSVSSVTPTTEMSDYSSTPAARPHSNHTADTSVDLPFSVASAKPFEARDSPGSSGSRDRPGSSLYVTAQEDDAHTDTTATSRPESRAGFDNHGAGQPDSLYLEGEDCDCASTEDSDVDSFVEKHRQARGRKDGVSPLFKEADLGNNLPGLFETAAKQPCLMCSLLQCAAIDPPFDASGTGAWATRPPCDHKGRITRRDRLRALGYEYDTDESPSEPEAEPEPEPEPEAEPEAESVPRGRTPTKRPAVASAGMRYGRIDEDEEPGAAAAALLVAKPRRESNRSRSNRSRSGRLGGRNRSLAIEPVLEDYEEGHAADVE